MFSPKKTTHKNSRRAGRRPAPAHAKSHQKKEESVGPIRLVPRGESTVTLADKTIVTITRSHLNTALDGDLVAVSQLKKGQARGASWPGRVSRIISRKRSEFVGTVEQVGGQTFVRPDDRRMYIDIAIPHQSTQDVANGEKVLARIESWKDPRGNPQGKIIRHLGQSGEHNVEMESIVLERGFRPEFSPAVTTEAEHYHQKMKEVLATEISQRRDFRSIPTFTIDPLTAQDFDDALSIQKLANGNYEVGIHIADVSWFVRPGTALDDEARRRATSIYLVDRTIPMLPEALSNDLCSLLPHTDRFTFSAVFELDAQAEIKNEWFGRTIIHSAQRFVYEDAQVLLDTKEGQWAEELNLLNHLAHRLRAKKIAAGALVFEDSEISFTLDEAGRPLSIQKKVRTDIHKLVEDFMLLANKQVAEYVAKKNKNDRHPFVYRIHGAPDADKLLALAEFLAPLGYQMAWKGKAVSVHEINRLLTQAAGAPEEGMVSRAAIRSMAKAIYSTSNVGHYGLGFDYYTHFTSPIRRYPDLIVHRLLAAYVADQYPQPEEITTYAELAAHCSEQERLAAEAERESIKYKLVEYMAEHIGEEWRGIVSGVSQWGLYVEDSTTKAEGMVRIDSLPADDYAFEEKKYALVGKRSKKAYRLGDLLTVRVIRADVKRRIIDLELIEPDPTNE